MIKLNHLPESVMDLVMQTAREFDMKPDQVIISILSNTTKEEAKRAIDEHKNRAPKIL
jgi:hypothetical protein